MKLQNYYHMLGIDPFASQDDIKRAYFKLLKEYHPDKKYGHNTFAGKRFQAALEAYEAIKTPEKRAAYDELLKIQIMNEQTTLRAHKTLTATAHNDNKTQESEGFIDWLLKPFQNNKKTGL